MVIFGINTTSDFSKLLYVISRAVRRVKFETILKYHEWYLCQISRTNHAIICLYYYPQKVWNFHIFTALSQSNCRNFSCSSTINLISMLLYCRKATFLSATSPNTFLINLAEKFKLNKFKIFYQTIDLKPSGKMRILQISNINYFLV